ncbi:helix-turn-helix domain-containing protein [Paenibacillus sp. PL91]|uniref:helix-turn-helix domain-containing protein n=1 Tax=Paenibacillus sp. PL91 TaxID=2729538 RepID=UPI00145C7D4A|nr:helix-turn-helix transcriptional regulator [Paenibacillus sp. PL91]MBC9199780.1 helix-turn-helix transcriptional regulator [Paenibacillus sp. PL91]
MDWNQNPVNLRCNLGELLKQKGISALQLSKDLDHRRSTINDLINNKDISTKRIPAQLIARICAYLDVTPNELFTIIHTE